MKWKMRWRSASMIKKQYEIVRGGLERNSDRRRSVRENRRQKRDTSGAFSVIGNFVPIT